MRAPQICARPACLPAGRGRPAVRPAGRAAGRPGGRPGHLKLMKAKLFFVTLHTHSLLECPTATYVYIYTYLHLYLSLRDQGQVEFHKSLKNERGHKSIILFVTHSQEGPETFWK